jgi:hypothetical protein
MEKERKKERRTEKWPGIYTPGKHVTVANRVAGSERGQEASGVAGSEMGGAELPLWDFTISMIPVRLRGRRSPSRDYSVLCLISPYFSCFQSLRRRFRFLCLARLRRDRNPWLTR